LDYLCSGILFPSTGGTELPFLGLGGPQFFGLALVLLLGSSPSTGGSLLTFNWVLHTKRLASPWCSPSVLWCSTQNVRPQCSSSVLSSGKFLFCCTICHSFLILHFTHSTSTSLSYPSDCYFSPLLFVSIFLDSLHSFFVLFFASFLFTLFPFD
jgi:hypothetical protein